jgi:hypothetical protein
MQQHRQPRLGDILDDYCPRERRITNHAVVAMVGPDIKQTRCTTCDAEHEFKHAKVPSTRKKKEAPSVLYKQVLASAQPESARAAQPAPGEENAASAMPPAQPAEVESPAPAAAPQAAAPAEDEAGVQAQDGTEPGDDEGPVHRRLIRATLPRPEGPTQRPLPQFTVRQPGKFSNTNTRGGGRPPGMGSMTRPRTSPSRGAFGRNGSRSDTFTTRSSGPSHHALQRARPGHGPSGRPVRHGKKSPK